MPKPWHGSYARFMAALLAGQCKPLRLHDQAGQYEEWEHVIPVGGLYLSAVSTDPGLPQAAGGLGYGSWASYAQGRCVVGANDTDWAAGTERGAENATPTGACTAPTFTGSAVASQSVSAGTPAGSCSAPTFTGSALATHTHTFTGNALANHAHELPVQLVSGTLSRQLASSVFGTGTSRAAQSQQTETANTTSAAVALSQSVSAGTPSGANASVSAGTPAGTVSAPTFTGSALATHAHNVTAAGTVSAPTFTGQAMSVVQPSIAVYVWRRVG